MRKLYLLIIAVSFSIVSYGQSYNDLINSIMGQNYSTVEGILSTFDDYKMYHYEKYGIRVDGAWIIMRTTFDYSLVELIVQKDNRDVIPNMPKHHNKRVGTRWTDYMYIYKPIKTLYTKDYEEALNYFQTIKGDRIYFLKNKKSKNYLVARITSHKKSVHINFYTDDKTEINLTDYECLAEK